MRWLRNKFKFKEIKHQPYTYKEITLNWVNKNTKISTIRVSEQTKKRLQNHGKMGENFEQLLNRLLDLIEKK